MFNTMKLKKEIEVLKSELEIEIYFNSKHKQIDQINLAQVTKWALKHGFLTGNADTMAGLLRQLDWQIAELQDKPQIGRVYDPYLGDL